MITDDLKIATRDLEHIPHGPENRAHARHAMGLVGNVVVVALASGRAISSGRCRLVDASYGGARIEIQHPGEEVARAIDLKHCGAQVSIPGEDGEIIALDCTIVWRAPAPLQGFVHLGLKFSEHPQVEIVDKLLTWSAHPPSARKPKRSSSRTAALLLTSLMGVALLVMYEKKAVDAADLAAALERETEKAASALGEAESLRAGLERCQSKVVALSAPVSLDVRIATDTDLARDLPSCSPPLELSGRGEPKVSCAYRPESGDPVLLLELERRAPKE